MWHYTRGGKYRKSLWSFYTCRGMGELTHLDTHHNDRLSVMMLQRSVHLRRDHREECLLDRPDVIRTKAREVDLWYGVAQSCSERSDRSASCI